MKPKVIYKENDLKTFLNGDSLISIILRDIVKNDKLIPERFEMIGIATNVLLGVFGIIYKDHEYKCYRVYYENKRLVISDVGYPITNMGGKFNIDCVIDYVISVRTIKMFNAKSLESAI